MAVAEKIEEYVRRLPERLQAEVLDFVEYLLAKAERESATREEREWTQLSLALAMRDMEEDEEDPDYSASDLKESFS
jgi:hypothetical protein